MNKDFTTRQTDQRPLPSNQVRALLTAAAMQNLRLVRYFIEVAGVPVDASEVGKPSALCYAAARRNRAMLDYLLDAGADPDYADDGGHSVLHYAALGGCIEIVARLIACGAALNRENSHGTTPLGLASEGRERAACAELLSRHGASLQAGPTLPKRFH